MAFAIAMTLEEPLAPPSPGPQRTCIATGETGAPDRMIRFVEAGVLDAELFEAILRRHALMDAWRKFQDTYLDS